MKYRVGLIFCTLLLLPVLGWAGGAAQSEQAEPEEQGPPPPPTIPGLPELTPEYRLPGDGEPIVAAYKEFADAAEALVEDAALRGLERNAGGIHGFRNTLQDWRDFWSTFLFFPESDDLTKEEVQTFLSRIVEIDAVLSTQVDRLNSLIDDQRVLTSDQFKIN